MLKSRRTFETVIGEACLFVCLFVPSKCAEGGDERSNSTRADETCGH